MFARALPFPSPSRSLPPKAPIRAERFVCFRGAPRLAPLCRRSSTGRVGPAPGPPCPLPCICSLCCGVCCLSFVCVQASLFYSGRCGRGCPVGPLLASLRSVRFKWALVGLSLPSRVGISSLCAYSLVAGLCRAVRPSVALRVGSLRSPRGWCPMRARPLPSLALARFAHVFITFFVN